MTDIDTLRDELARLESAARPLEPDAAERARLGEQVLGHALAFHEGLADLPAYVPPPGASAAALEPEFAAGGREAAGTLDFLAKTLERPGITTASPRFMGYIPGGGLYHAGLGDLLAATSNKYAGFAPAGPGAVRIENACVRWMAGVVGYPHTASGTLTSGGSLANLTAIIAAREARDPDGGGAIYTTAFAHHCVDKALKIADRHRAPHRRIATDERTRMRADALRDALEKDRAAGIRPWLVIASAGTIDAGAIDPLAEIAALAREFGAWFHVDGAYGGLFALCDEGKARLAGMEQADSLALDPHKTLFLPYGTGAVLVRNGRLLHNAFSAEADYIQPFGDADVGPSPANLSPELTRHFRGLRLWLPLQLAGLDAFRAAQTEKLLLARYFHSRLGELPEILGGPEPELSVVAFRHRGGDAASEALLERLQAGGRVMLSGTRINGRFHLRAAILCFRTHVEHVDIAIDAVREALADA